MILYRFNMDGSPDLSFGSAGYITYDLSSGSDEDGSSIDMDGDKYVILGSHGYGTLLKAVMWRINNDGTYDTSFITDGYLLISVLDQDYGTRGRNVKVKDWFYYFNATKLWPPMVNVIGRVTMDSQLDTSIGDSDTPGLIKLSLNHNVNFLEHDGYFEFDQNNNLIGST